jgi:integrase
MAFVLVQQGRAMPLTDVLCRNRKPAAKRQKLSDGGGLQLWVQPNGSKFWYLAYRYGGVQRQLALGPYPAVSLAEAREMRNDAQKLLRSGDDPASARDAHRAAQDRPRETFKEIAEEYVAKLKREERTPATLVKKEWLLGQAYPELGAKRVSEIRPVDVLRVLQQPESRGCYETARRLRATIGAVCRYAIATARAETDPTSALRDALTTPTVTPRAAITDPMRVGGLLRAIDGFDGQPTTRAALKLMALLFPRPGELRTAEWVEFDLAGQLWLIPASKTKMRRAHRIFLPRQASDVLEELQPITGHGKLVFPGFVSSRRPMSENTLNGALRRLGFGQDEMTAHGFRATASTLLNESGKWSSDAIERQLAHVETNAVRRAYARGEHWDERVRMMSWWADYLDQLRDGGAVVPLLKRSV